MFCLPTPHGSSRTLAKAALMHNSPPCSQTGLVQIERYRQSRVLIRIRADAALGFKRLEFFKEEHYVTSQNRSDFSDSARQRRDLKMRDFDVKATYTFIHCNVFIAL